MTQLSHPHEYAQSVLAVNRAIREVELSTYINVPESLTDERETYRVGVQDIQRRFDALLNSLTDEQEIAFHSRVHLQGRKGGLRPRHMPLVDFKTQDRNVAEAAAERLIREGDAPSAALFGSGRSYHLYIDVLMSERQWIKFMGRVLLLNPREGPVVIDNRWIGHRLMSGFGALRWSANTSPYSEPPRLLRRWGS